MKIYTRKGDAGQTGIWAGVRLAKDQARIEAIGSVDELNAAVGFAAAAVRQGGCFDDGDPVPDLLGSVQQDLLVAGTELMAPRIRRQLHIAQERFATIAAEGN